MENKKKIREFVNRESKGQSLSKPDDSEQVEKEKGNLDNFLICEQTKKTLRKEKIEYLFPIQYATFNLVYEKKDLIGRDRTGSGKTLAFCLPVLERMRKNGNYFKNVQGQRPLILILVPTRELAIQVTKELNRFKNSPKEYRLLSVYGGTDINKQINALMNGVEVVVGTPGRIIDLISREHLYLNSLQVFVFDETDIMLEIGFKVDIEKILNFTKQDLNHYNRKMEEVQFLLFSATIPQWIDKIALNFMKKDLIRINMIKNSEVKTSKTVKHLSIFLSNKTQKINAIGDII